MNQIGIVGGIAGFYASIIMVIVGYFAEIDYLSGVIKKLYLEEQSDKKFFARFLNEDKTGRKSKPKFLKEFCEDFFHYDSKPLDEEKIETYQDTRRKENDKV